MTLPVGIDYEAPLNDLPARMVHSGCPPSSYAGIAVRPGHRRRVSSASQRRRASATRSVRER